MKILFLPLIKRVKHLVHKVNKKYSNVEAKAKWQRPKCGVGLPYNPTYEIEGLCSTCRTYDDSERLLGGHRLEKRTR